MNKPHDLPLHVVVDADDLNPTANPSFNQVLDARMSRRSLLRGGVGGAATAVLGSFGLAACGGGGDDALATGLRENALAKNDKPIETLNFGAVPKSLADVVSVPAGYTATVIYALGDPLDVATPDYKNDGSDTDFDRRAGDHHDGMEFFPLSANGTRRDPKGSVRGILAINHEATSHRDVRSYFIHTNGGTLNPRPQLEATKEIGIHGISVVEVRKASGRFATVRDSSFNRRITPLTPVVLSGPLRGHSLARTVYSPTGVAARGTINNCGSGYSPWGTYLSGEENWAGYFTRAATDNGARTAAGDAKSVTSLNRYGRAQGAASRHGWETVPGGGDTASRWNIGVIAAAATADYRNELNTFGYIVEIDPYDKSVALRKRSALGRFAHESAAFAPCRAGRPLAVYMGDDSRGEYIYKFVSAATWSDADYESANRIATGDKYLDVGKLYVARFAADGSGSWIELTIDNALIRNYSAYAFADQTDVLVNARLAADAVGATKMDRPEWCSVHPTTGEIYYTLTNNSNRKLEPTGTQQPLDAANPRSYRDSFNGGAPGAPGNVNGHIIRMAETGAESTAITFTWDVYLFGAQADADPALVNLSSLTSDQDFSSPDGLWFSPSTKLCWIQTDDGSYADVTNCMMLAGVPGRVGDGRTQRLSYTKTDGSAVAIDTHIGATPSASTLKRFLVGPGDCEITGCTETPDGRALFVNIQHPGETLGAAADVLDPNKYLSHWPGNAGYGAGGATARPRSATIVITKDDGGRIGS